MTGVQTCALPISKVKEAEAKTKEADPKANDAFTSQSSQKEDPPAPKAKA